MNPIIKSTPESSTSTRVAAYCRVSTKEEDQQNSYTAQIEYYEKYISCHSEWTLTKIYADKGISGTQAKNRTEFIKMIRQCRRHRIDLVLCKSISRFARNTVDLLNYIRELRALGVRVIFEKENIDTDDMSSELMLSLYATFAQAESESISRNITWGIEKSFQNGNVRYNFSQMLGYKMDESGKPLIIEEEAKIIREIFSLFANGTSMADIAHIMTNRKVPRRSGSTTWTRKNVQQILINEKYAGNALLQKSYTTNYLTHKRAKNTGQKPQYLIQNCHPAIIDKETYNAVQEQFRKRSMARHSISPNTANITPESPVTTNTTSESPTATNITNSSAINYTPTSTIINLYSYSQMNSTQISSHKYNLNHLLICAECESHYRRAIWRYKGHHYAVWRCGNRIENGKRYCHNSPTIHEDALHRFIIDSINEHFKLEGDNSLTIYDDSLVIELIKSITVNGNSDIIIDFIL